MYETNEESRICGNCELYEEEVGGIDGYGFCGNLKSPYANCLILLEDTCPEWEKKSEIKTPETTAPETVPTIITYSGQARHGKTTSAQMTKHIIESCGKTAIEISYADYLKFIAKQYMGWDGNKDEAGRTLLQELGTEKTRKKLPNMWVDTVINLAKIFEEDYDYILIDDCRFPNEIERWEEEDYNIITVHVNRPNFDNGLTQEQKKHPSETALNEYSFDITIDAETLKALEEEITEKLGGLLLCVT